MRKPRAPVPTVDRPHDGPYLPIVRTLDEIERALPGLRTEELVHLDDVLDATLRTRRKRFTGNDAVLWWRGRARMTVEDAEAFAADVAAGRKETNLPPSTPRWE
jgi:hypothetical protein